MAGKLFSHSTTIRVLDFRHKRALKRFIHKTDLLNAPFLYLIQEKTFVFSLSFHSPRILSNPCYHITFLNLKRTSLRLLKRRRVDVFEWFLFHKLVFNLPIKKHYDNLLFKVMIWIKMVTSPRTTSNRCYVPTTNSPWSLFVTLFGLVRRK